MNDRGRRPEVTRGDKFEAITSAAGRILDAYGRPETSDSARVMYAAGELNIAREAGRIEIIFRGSLVFRHAPEEGEGGRVFEEHGPWAAEVERLSARLPDPPAS